MLRSSPEGDILLERKHVMSPIDVLASMIIASFVTWLIAAWLA